VNLTKLLLVIASLVLLDAAQAQTAEHPPVPRSSKQFVESFDRSIDFLEKEGFDRELKAPSLNAITSNSGKALLAAIVAETPIKVGMGEAETEYDIILQPGHYGRRTGVVGAAGTAHRTRCMRSAGV
jgi:hypothetical protein